MIHAIIIIIILLVTSSQDSSSDDTSQSGSGTQSSDDLSEDREKLNVMREREERIEVRTNQSFLAGTQDLFEKDIAGIDECNYAF